MVSQKKTIVSSPIQIEIDKTKLEESRYREGYLKEELKFFAGQLGTKISGIKTELVDRILDQLNVNKS